MLITKIINGCKDIKSVRMYDNSQRDMKIREAIDEKYKNKIIEALGVVYIVKALKENLNFILEQDIKDCFIDLSDFLNISLESGYANEETITTIDAKLKKLKIKLKSCWLDYYDNNVSIKKNVLEVIKSVNEELVCKCIKDIEIAKVLPENFIIIKNLKRAMQDGNKLIDNLHLDEEILMFLKKVNKGAATVADLTPKVLEWIKDEKLDQKIKVRFN